MQKWEFMWLAGVFGGGIMQMYFPFDKWWKIGICVMIGGVFIFLLNTMFPT